MIDSTDDVGTQLSKLTTAMNELIELNKQLGIIGGEKNIVDGKYANMKMQIRVKKDEINVLKVLVRAEGSHL